jgi:hypothetical protein
MLGHFFVHGVQDPPLLQQVEDRAQFGGPFNQESDDIGSFPDWCFPHLPHHCVYPISGEPDVPPFGQLWNIGVESHSGMTGVEARELR